MNKTLSFFVLHGDDGIFRGLSVCMGCACRLMVRTPALHAPPGFGVTFCDLQAASLPEDVAHSPHANDSVARLFRRTPLATAVERLAELAIPLHERPDNKLLGHYFVLAGGVCCVCVCVCVCGALVSPLSSCRSHCTSQRSSWT